MTRVLILGYGNPLRGDDGFGPALAQRLQNDFSELHGDSDVEIIASHQLALEYAEPLSRARRVVFVDANAGGTPGVLVFQSVDAMSQVAARLTHHLSPQTLLTYADSLYGARPSEAFLLSVSGEHFGYSETLSDTVTEALERAHAQLLEFCAA